MSGVFPYRTDHMELIALETLSPTEMFLTSTLQILLFTRKTNQNPMTKNTVPACVKKREGDSV